MKKTVLVLGAALLLVFLPGGCAWLEVGVPNGTQPDGTYDPTQDERQKAPLTVRLPGSPADASSRAFDLTWSTEETTHYGVWAVEHGQTGNAQYYLASTIATAVQFMVSVGSTYEIYVLAAAVDAAAALEDPPRGVYYITGGGNNNVFVETQDSYAVTVTLNAVDYGSWTLTEPTEATSATPPSLFTVPDGTTVPMVYTHGRPLSSDDLIRMNLNFRYTYPGATGGDEVNWSVQIFDSVTDTTEETSLTAAAATGDHTVLITGSDGLEFADGASGGDWFIPASNGDVFEVLPETPPAPITAHSSPLDDSLLFTVDVGASANITIEWETEP